MERLMKMTIILTFILIFSTSIALADNNCFIYKKNDQVIKTGECDKRSPPQSTFKIAISLMGYDNKILIDETHPEVPFVKGYPDNLESWKHPQTPQSWLKNSCVWYSQYITKKLGMKTFKAYLKKFDYGNQDASGSKGKDGLTYSWITSSLKISPREQILFLDKLLNSKLPITKEAHTLTRNVLYLEDLPNGWKLFGKTGAGDLLKSDGTNDKTRERGWFVGWIENKTEKIIFAQYVELKNIKTSNNFSYIASKEAKKMAIAKILESSVHGPLLLRTKASHSPTGKDIHPYQAHQLFFESLANYR